MFGHILYKTDRRTDGRNYHSNSVRLTTRAKSKVAIMQVFKMVSFGANACRQPWPPLVDGLVDDALRQFSPDRDEALLQVLDIACFCVVDRAFLYQPLDPIVDRTEVCGEFAGQSSGPITSGPRRSS